MRTMNDVAGPTATQEQNADRLLKAIYVLSDGKVGVPVSRDSMLAYVNEHRLFRLTDEEYAVWHEMHFIPVLERAQKRKPQA
jgi:hypothetical protein